MIERKYQLQISVERQHPSNPYMIPQAEKLTAPSTPFLDKVCNLLSEVIKFKCTSLRPSSCKSLLCTVITEFAS